MGGFGNLFGKDVQQTTTNTADYNLADNSLNADGPILTGGSSISVTNNDTSAEVAAVIANLATNSLGLANADNARATGLAQDAMIISGQTSSAAFSAAADLGMASASVAARAIESNTSTTDTALRASVQTSERAIAAAQEQSRVTASAITQSAAASISAAQESARIASSASLQAAQLAASSAAESSRLAISGVTQAANSALSSNTEVTRLGYSAILQGQDRSLETADRAVQISASIAADSTENARQIVLANNALTETTREGNQQLVKLVADKLSTSVADERKNINADIIQSSLKWGAATAVGLALAIGITMAFRRKA